MKALENIFLNKNWLAVLFEYFPPKYKSKDAGISSVKRNIYKGYFVMKMIKTNG